MAFPVFESVAHLGWTGNQTTGELPWGTTAAGDLLIGLGQCDGGSPDVPEFPVGVNDFDAELVSQNEGQHGMSMAYRICDGDETGNFTMNVTSLEVVDVFLIRILAANWHGTTPPAVLLGSQVSSATPDVGSLNPADWGTEETLWIAWRAGDNGGITVVAYPMAGNQHQHSGLGNNSICSVESEVAALDPDAWSLSGSDQCTAGIIAVRPAAAGSATLTADPGALLFTGATAALAQALISSPGALQLSGASAALALGLVSSPGALLFTGAEATLVATVSGVLTADPGALILTGAEATLDFTALVVRRGGVRWLVEPDEEIREEKVKELTAIIKPALKPVARTSLEPQESLLQMVSSATSRMTHAQQTRTDRLLQQTGISIEELLILLQ